MTNQEKNCPKLQVDYQKLVKAKEEFDVLFTEAKKEKVTLNNINQIKPKVRTAIIKKQELKDKFKQIKEGLIPKIVRALMETETEKLSEFFGEEIEVPAPSEEITKERIEKWKEQGFELHYLPKIDMSKKKELKTWQKKANDLFKHIVDGNVDSLAANLSAGWILIDGRDKPVYDDGKQMYEQDILSEVIKELSEGTSLVITDSIQEGSRFNISWNELNNERTKEVFAKVLGVKKQQIDLPRAIEWNVIGNMYHPEWGYYNTREWFSDNFGNNERLNGGTAGWGGLSFVRGNETRYHGSELGFRLLVRFPE